jgi:8-oxo-dGTP diphosphatase
VLVCRRRASDLHPGKWEFPGGKIEPGESPQDCLKRELAEELGIAGAIGDEIARRQHAYTNGPTVDLWFFDVPSFTGDLSNRVFAEIRWVRPEALAELDLLDADRPVVDLLRADPRNPVDP